MEATSDADQAQFKYEVAISFEGSDEALAAEIADALQDRFSTFIYSRKQDELAGRDGEERFREVFGSQARVVIVLYRPEWGQTSFTRIEEKAIRDRAYNNGYDFTLFIPTTEPPEVPKWLPKARLYYSWKRFGIKGLPAVVARLIEEHGGETRVESLADCKAQFQRDENFRREQQTFSSSGEGYKAFEKAADELKSKLKTEFTDLKGTIPTLQILDAEATQYYFIVHSNFLTLIISKRARWTNELDTCSLKFSYYDKCPQISGYIYVGDGDERLLREKNVTFWLIQPGESAFIMDEESYTPDKLAEYIVKQYLNIAQHPRSRRAR